MLHSNPSCIFNRKPYLFIKQILNDFNYLNHLDRIFRCDCYLFAWTHNNPSYANADITEEEYQYYMERSDSWKLLGSTKYNYNLISRGTSVFRDPYVKDALKQYDLQKYYRICDKNKTPRVGRMYFSLLQYLYPVAKPPSHKEHYFYKCLDKSINYVFRNFKKTKPISAEMAWSNCPKNTSAGFIYLQYGNHQSKKKSEMEKEILQEYKNIYYKVTHNQSVNDYCMFAMRGHLSDRTKVKTRPVWLVSAPTVLAELRFYQPLYDQINNIGFWKKHLITGSGSLPRLRRYLLSNPESTFINTDISGWDSYRASWFHEKIMRKAGQLFEMDYNDRLLYKYCIDSAIRTKVLFPNGKVYQKKAGIISGTAGTLLFNSLLNMIAGFCILNMMKMYNLDIFNEDFCSKISDPNWLGDDFSFFTDFNFDLEKFGSMMFKYFNVHINTDKTIVAKTQDERKYLGYQLKDGYLFREEKELFQSLLYCERAFPEKDGVIGISFSRFFSYLLLGGINNYNFVEFFYFYCGFYKDKLENVDFFSKNLDNIFKLLKDVWNINIPVFNLATFRSVNLIGLKYCLLYNWDFKFEDILFG